MAQFDVYRVRGNVLVLDCQSDLLSSLTSRFVVPLRRSESEAPTPTRRLTPTFDIAGERYVMMTPIARSIDRRDIEATVASLAVREYEIKAAIDFLTGGI